MRDREHLRAAALHAAASVALALGLGACAPKAATEADSATGLYGSDTATSDGASDGADGAADGADGASDGADGAADGSDGADGGTDGGTDGSTDGSDGTAERGPDCTTVPPEDMGACCSDRADWCQDRYGDSSEEYAVCLWGPDYSGEGTGCIPWGPPVPPRFGGERRLGRAAVA